MESAYDSQPSFTGHASANGLRHKLRHCDWSLLQLQLVLVEKPAGTHCAAALPQLRKLNTNTPARVQLCNVALVT